MPDHNLADDQLIAAVRRAFSHYSAPPAVPPFLRHGAAVGQPRLNRLSLAVVPIAALGLVIVLIAQALTQPGSAFATWTAVPAEPDPAVAASAAEECWTPSLQPAPARLPLVAVDQRGRVTLALFSDGESLTDCMLVDGQVSAVSHGAETGGDSLTGAIQVLNHGRYERESTVMHLISGAVASDVASVIVTRDDGVDVTATVGTGVFLVWWPTPGDAATFTALDAAGNVLETIENPIRLPSPPQ